VFHITTMFAVGVFSERPENPCFRRPRWLRQILLRSTSQNHCQERRVQSHRLSTLIGCSRISSWASNA